LTKPPILRDILNQPKSLSQVLAYQLDEGLPALQAAAQVLRGGRPITLSGMGSSLFACLALQNQLASNGVPTSVIDTAELLHYHTPMLREKIVVLVSRSGESVEVIKLLPALKEQNACIIGVTDTPDSSLARGASGTILINGLPDDAIAVQSYTATLMTLHLLAAAYARELDQAHQEIEDLISKSAICLDRYVEASQGWQDFFEDLKVLYLLGRGASIASAQQGALMFNEVSKVPAVAMSGGQFRHGPVEIVDEDFRALIFAPRDATQALNLGMANDLIALSGQVKLIGPKENASRPFKSVLWEIPIVPPSLAPILEIIPVQFATLRLAQWQGIQPGVFRYGSQVTRSETGFG
jgi:glucosamine--fructose-6-phosphate aminotransferase (isomerizing)